MKTIILFLCASMLMLVGCATTSNLSEWRKAYHNTCISQWGPEEQWTEAQKRSYLQGLLEKREQLLAANRAASYAPQYQPQPYQYQPILQGRPNYSRGTTTYIPDGNGSTGGTIWGADGPRRVIPDGNGGFTIW